MLKKFRVLGYFEGLSFLLLLGVAMPLKYLAGEPLAVRIVGLIHGILFIAYVGFATKLATEMRWPTKTLALAWISAVLPFGPFFFDRRFKEQ